MQRACAVFRFQRPPRTVMILAVVMFAGGYAMAQLDMQPIPFVKRLQARAGRLPADSVTVVADAAQLGDEVAALRALLTARGIGVGTNGSVIRLALVDIEFPEIGSRYRAEIEQQGYRLHIDGNGVSVRAPTPVGVFYAIQTLAQLFADDRSLPYIDILDWPDFAVRAVMVDMARANENAAYYTRMLQFCAHYKINRLHLHLTDDDNASLYHEDYPALMHPHAWRAEQLAPLVALASRLHIELVPEIESLGHARLFLRHPDRAAFLHQTTDEQPKRSWAGTNVPGLTNVLCPASDRTYEYLDKMYARAAEIFPGPEIHIGCDEVDMTDCARCKAKFGDISSADWFLKHVLVCRALAAKRSRSIGLWGDMLLHHPDAVAGLPTSGTTIYDWHYNPDMTDESIAFFQQQGFEIIACPALVCHPHMILPSDFNYGNIQRFAALARAHDVLGFDVTVWTPIRYLSDALWPGLAFATTQAWGGSSWQDEAFYSAFARDYFGSPAGKPFGDAWTELASIRWWLKDFKLSCWIDDEDLAAAAQAAASEKGMTAQQHREKLHEIMRAFADIDSTVKQNRPAWRAIVHSVTILDTVLEHLLAAPEVRQGERLNAERIRQLDERCTAALSWIEQDWDRNRFADDPYKDDLNHTGQHLLDRFRRMHEYHRELLKRAAKNEK